VIEAEPFTAGAMLKVLFTAVADALIAFVPIALAR
jgi:hypothetical protein